MLAAGIMAGSAWRPELVTLLRSCAWFAVGTLVAVSVTPWRRWRLLCLPAGFLLALLHEAAPWDGLGRALPRPACRASLRGVVRDPQCHADTLDALPPTAAAVVHVEGLLLPGRPAWQVASGRALVLLPRGTCLAYGDSVEAAGVFLAAVPAPFPRAFDYREYLRRNGVRQVFQADRIAPTGPPRGVAAGVRWLLDCRDLLAGRLVAHIRSEENAAVLLAMTFGFRQTLPASTRDAFLRSGTIHVFSVSGLHVGIVSVVLGYGLSLSGVPYRWRHGLLPLLLGVYVLMTGAAPPAVRAWLMVSAVSWAKAWFLTVSVLNAVAFAALVIMASQPLVLFQAGFLYSFVTVAILVLGWPHVSGCVADLCERQLWLPRCQRRHWQTYSVRLALQAMSASLLAWFGGSGLMLYLSAMLVPAALPVNVLLVLLANGLLVMALPKILLACLPWVLPDRLAAGLMDAFVEAIRALVTCGSSPAGSWAVPSPPLTLIVVYYASLFAALAPRVPRSWRCAAMVIAAGLLALATWAPWHRPALALVWGADCDVPVVAIERPDGLPPLVLHSGTPEALRALLSWLQLRGHRRADALVLAWDSRRAVEAAPTAVALLHADTLIVPDPPRPGSFLDQACQAQHERGARTRVLTSLQDIPGGYRGAWPGGEVHADITPDRRRLHIDAGSPGGRLHIRLGWDLTGRYRVTVVGDRGQGCALAGPTRLQRCLTEVDLGPSAAILARPGVALPPRRDCGPVAQSVRADDS